ncbi:MAG TPA: CoA-transferase [Syntrophomonadaceae bacterium]|nr:CoA-transferase [Syntrophomonadaceae bacterium]HRX20887.1 CoA-transferase [Syntrophomonadaceae bacterium]
MQSKFSYNEEAVENLRISDTSVLDRLIDHESFRENNLKKKRTKIDKRMTLSEAVATFVNDGDIVADSGFSYVRSPLMAHFEICRQQKKQLQYIGSPNTLQSFTVFAGCCNYTHNSYVGAEMRGTDRMFSASVKQGRTKIISEWGHGSMGIGFKAAQYGMPYAASKQLLGSDMLKYNPYVKETIDPWSGKPAVLIPALHPDVVFIHCQQADKYGNGKIFGPAVNDIAEAFASRKVILTCEEVVPELSLRFDSSNVVIPFMVVDAVVELPYGCLPGCCPGYYYWAREWWEWLMRIATRDQAAMQDFMDVWVYGCKDQYELMDKLSEYLGGSRYMDNLRRLQKAEEYLIEDIGIDFSYEQVVPKRD